MPSISTNKSLWDSGDVLGLPVLEGEHRADVCVIGLGGSGLVCVRELTRLGANVIGVDAGRVGGSAAGRNGGFLLAGLAPFYHEAVRRFGREHASAMYRATLDELSRIRNDTPGAIIRNGSLRIAESENEWLDCQYQLSAMLRDSFAASAYEGPEGRGLLIPDDGVFQPFERCAALARAATAEGAQLYENSPATTSDGSVHTPHGCVVAKTTIVAADGALPEILPELGNEVRTARLQMLASAPTAEIVLSRPVYARWGYDYWQQLPDGSLALGGARDVGGEAEWTDSTETTDLVQGALERRLRKTLGVHAPVTHRWSASVSYSGDNLPVIREVRSNVWAIGAYSGTGNVIGSLLGRGIARMLMCGDNSLVVSFLGR